jgi:hypothetical protein
MSGGKPNVNFATYPVEGYVHCGSLGGYGAYFVSGAVGAFQDLASAVGADEVTHFDRSRYAITILDVGLLFPRSTSDKYTTEHFNRSAISFNLSPASFRMILSSEVRIVTISANRVNFSTQAAT